MKKYLMCCPYCNKIVGIDAEVTGIALKEKKVNQKTYEEFRESLQKKQEEK